MINQKMIDDLTKQKYDLALQFTKFKYEFNKFMDLANALEKELTEHDSSDFSIRTSDDFTTTKK